MILYANTLTQTHTHNSNNETNNSECPNLQQQQTYDPKSTLIIFWIIFSLLHKQIQKL